MDWTALATAVSTAISEAPAGLAGSESVLACFESTVAARLSTIHGGPPDTVSVRGRPRRATPRAPRRHPQPWFDVPC